MIKVPARPHLSLQGYSPTSSSRTDGHSPLLSCFPLPTRPPLWPLPLDQRRAPLAKLSTPCSHTWPPEFSAAAGSFQQLTPSHLWNCLSSLPGGSLWHRELGQSNGGASGVRLNAPGSTLNQRGWELGDKRSRRPPPPPLQHGGGSPEVGHLLLSTLLLDFRLSLSHSPVSQKDLRLGLGCRWLVLGLIPGNTARM